MDMADRVVFQNKSCSTKIQILAAFNYLEQKDIVSFGVSEEVLTVSATVHPL